MTFSVMPQLSAIMASGVAGTHSEHAGANSSMYLLAWAERDLYSDSAHHRISMRTTKDDATQSYCYTGPNVVSDETISLTYANHASIAINGSLSMSAATAAKIITSPVPKPSQLTMVLAGVLLLAAAALRREHGQVLGHIAAREQQRDSVRLLLALRGKLLSQRVPAQ